MSSASIRILLVEDDLGDADLICELLELVRFAHFQVTLSRRLSETLQYLCREPFDVVLLDLSLPDSHGLATVDSVYTQLPTVPIVILSGLEDELLAIEALQKGAQDYLVKGRVDSDLLARAISYAIERTKILQLLNQKEKQLQQANEDLESQVQKRTAQLQQALDFEAVLKRITDKVRDSLDESQILQTVVRELALSLNVASCDATLYNLEQGTATICYEHTITLPSVQGRVLQMANFPEIFHPLLQGKYFQYCPITTNPVQGQAVMLACPIFDAQGALGNLCLCHQTNYAFNDLELRLVQQVANQCAIAIRQARLYQACVAQVLELEKLNCLKDDFLSTVSHELRTPVSNMKMSIRMLDIVMNRDFAFNEQRSQAIKYLKILHDECEREISLINDLLDLQRLEAGVQPLNAQTIQLQTWLPQVVKPFEARTQAREQVLEIDMPDELPPLVSDLSGLERILAELLTNACKYTPPGEQIMVIARAKPEVIQIKVINFGTEIPELELPRIFDKFYRVPSADPWKQGGTGLGLTLVKKLIKHLGGTLHVESTDGKTAFTVELPSNVPLKAQ